MKRTKWVDRKFHFNIPEGWLPNVIARLEGTTMRLNNLTNNLPEESISYKFNNGWSIKEHIGHLADLEDLHLGRIIDFSNRKELLRAADMSNKQTNEADHNTDAITELIEQFHRKRTFFVEGLKSLDDETQQFISVHPRLHEKLKPVDIAFFTAEHDDHHIASIYTIIESIK